MEIKRVAVTFEKDDMIWVNRVDGVVEPTVDRHDHLLGRVGWLVDQIVSCYPPIVTVALGKDLPEMHNTILELFVFPEQRLVGRVVRVPMLILIARQRMQ